nr:uncharacterized protein LOC129271826 [Lytechinus pictus]
MALSCHFSHTSAIRWAGTGPSHGILVACERWNSFPCTSSCYMNVSVTLVCDGYYDCDNYEDESLCEYPSSYLQTGEYFIYVNNVTRKGSYNAHLFQTNVTNGFQIIFRDLYLYFDEKIQIGTGTDPSDLHSVITTINGYRHCCPSDVYVESSDMWIARIGGIEYPLLELNAEIRSTEIFEIFPCSLSNMDVPMAMVCDGYYDCDHYEDESNCNNPVTHLEEGQSLTITSLSNTRGFYNTTLLKANTTNGFRIVFHRLNLNYDDEIRIGTGNDPSDLESIVTTVHGYASYAKDVYIDTHKMWVVVIGSKQNSHINLKISVTAIDSLSEYLNFI